MKIGDSGALDHGTGGIMCRLGFSGKTGDYIGTKNNVRPTPARLVAKPHNVARQMATFHLLQNKIIPMLRRQMQVWHQPLVISQHIPSKNTGEKQKQQLDRHCVNRTFPQ